MPGENQARKQAGVPPQGSRQSGRARSIPSQGNGKKQGPPSPVSRPNKKKTAPRQGPPSPVAGAQAKLPRSMTNLVATLGGTQPESELSKLASVAGLVSSSKRLRMQFTDYFTPTFPEDGDPYYIHKYKLSQLPGGSAFGSPTVTRIRVWSKMPVRYGNGDLEDYRGFPTPLPYAGILMGAPNGSLTDAVSIRGSALTELTKSRTSQEYTQVFDHDMLAAYAEGYEFITDTNGASEFFRLSFFNKDDGSTFSTSTGTDEAILSMKVVVDYTQIIDIGSSCTSYTATATGPQQTGPAATSGDSSVAVKILGLTV